MRIMLVSRLFKSLGDDTMPMSVPPNRCKMTDHSRRQYMFSCFPMALRERSLEGNRNSTMSIISFYHRLVPIQRKSSFGLQKDSASEPGHVGMQLYREEERETLTVAWM